MSKSIQEAFAGFVATIERLRDPKDGCPWDLKQDFLTLRRYMLEEAYEAIEAMTGGEPGDIQGELGDVLLQVVLNAQVAKDKGLFDIKDVILDIDEKMRRRHPHVFGDTQGEKVSVEDVKNRWQEIKEQEKGRSGGEKGFFADIKKDAPYPASILADKIGKRSKKIAFDWQSPKEVLAHLESEISELKAEVEKPEKQEAAIENELGDVFFTLSQLARHLGKDPETMAACGNDKFLKRFAALEKLAHERGVVLKDADAATKEKIWQDAKKK